LTLAATIFAIAEYFFLFLLRLGRGNSPRNKQCTERMSQAQLTELVHVASIASKLRSIQAI
jgi:hypothetical protein